jgi:hypothetical protein
MSHPLLPKNLPKTSALVREGATEYTKLLADPFPVPDITEAGTRLEVTDNGDRYVWTGTQWVQTHHIGFPLPVETSDRGSVALPVILTDQTTDMLDLVFLEIKVTGLTLAADTDADLDLRTFDLAGGHGLTNATSLGHFIELADNTNGRFIQSEILDITGDTVTIRQPISRIFTVAATEIATGNPNMVRDPATLVVIDGSTTPVIFTIKPLASQAGDITRIMAASISPNVSDYTTFGGADALTVGMTLRKKRADGTYKNLYTYVNNRDFVLHGFDNEPDSPKATGNATHGRASRVTFAGQDKHGVAERLDGALGEELQIVIFELMKYAGATGNLDFRFMGEGSQLQGP